MEEENISQNGSITDGKSAAGNPKMDSKNKKNKFGVLKLAVRLFQPSPKSREKQQQEEVNEITKPAKWKKIVGSMRPLHLTENLNSPTRSDASDASPRQGDSDDNFICRSSVSSPSTSFSSRKSSMSQYNSPMSQYNSPMSQYNSPVNLQAFDSPTSHYALKNNLQDLDEEEEKDPDQAFDSITEDEMIDSKADQFIAQFYQGIRLERSNRTDIGGRWML